MGSSVDSQSSDYNQIKMKSLLVFAASVLAVNGQFFGYPYAGYAANPLNAANPVTYSYTPQVIKPVAKEIEVPVTTIEYGVAETGCKNVFGFPVPCLAEGEARKKRDADAEADAAVLYSGYPGYYGHGFGYAGYPFGAYAVTTATPTALDTDATMLPVSPFPVPERGVMLMRRRPLPLPPPLPSSMLATPSVLAMLVTPMLVLDMPVLDMPDLDTPMLLPLSRSTSLRSPRSNTPSMC